MIKQRLLVAIGGIITGVIANIIYGAIQAKVDNIKDFFNSFLSISIPLWFAIISVIVAVVICLLLKEVSFNCKNRKEQSKEQKMPFLECTERDFRGYTFQWVWEKMLILENIRWLILLPYAQNVIRN